jgi:antitoxin HicB
MSDGDTPEEAIQNGRDAFVAWMSVRMQDLKQAAPKATKSASQPARFVLRTPKTLHKRLVEKAEYEGVSLNTLITALIAEGLGKQQAQGLQ